MLGHGDPEILENSRFTMPTRTAYVYFGIHGDFDPHEFAGRIAFPPDDCIARHSHFPLRKIPVDSILRYAEVETFEELIDIDGLAERVVETLEPHRNEMAAALAAYPATACLHVVLYFPMKEEISTPITSFSAKVVSFVAAMGGYIDIDMYRRDSAGD